MRGILVAALLVVLVGGAGAYFYFQQAPQGEIVGAADESRIAALESLGDRAPAGARANGDGLRALGDAAAGFASIEFGSVADEDGGAVARDVVVTFNSDAAESGAMGLRIAELRAWGVDGAGDGAAGQSRIADRLDMRGVSSFGLGALLEKQTRAYTDLIAAGVEEMAPEAEIESDLATHIEQYDVGADRILIDGLTIHPAEDRPAVEGDASFMAMLAWMADANRRTSFDASAVFGLTLTMKMEQGAGGSDMTISAPLLASEGWRRGDLDFSVVKDLAFNMDIVVPATQTVDAETGELIETPSTRMDMGGGYGLLTIADLKMARLYAHLANGALPPTTETDVMSLGLWRVRDERQTFGGREIASTKEATVDLTKFHWLIPTDIRINTRGGSYNIGVLLDYVQEMAAGGGDAAQDVEPFEQMTAALKENGLDIISYDADMAASWNPKDGAAASHVNLVAQDMLDWRQSFEGALPDFDTVAQLLPAEGETFDWEAAKPRVLAALALRRGSLALTDRGAIDKGFAMAVAMAKLAPEGDPSAAMMRDADPADLRVSSAAMIRLTSQQFAQMFPPAVGYMNAVADFVQKGGTLRVEATPPAPLTAALLESEAEAMETDPGRLAELLGLTVTHEPASPGGQ